MKRSKLNAMNSNFFEEILKQFSLIKDDHSVRTVVLSSAFKHVFTAGLDLKETTGFPGTNGKDPAREAILFMKTCSTMQAAFNAIESCNKPVICAIAGICIGGGIDMITACDIRFATIDSVFSVREVDVGLAADLGTLQRLPKVVGNQSWVRDVCLTARDFKAQEAFEFGLVSKLFENHEEMMQHCIKLAHLIASKAPIATYGTKSTSLT